MKLIATMPVRNEAWIVGLSTRAALTWVDELVILNHASTDGTVDILAALQAEFPGRVHVVSTPEQQWSEMQHRQFMLDLARAKGASHIAIVDADEILTGNLIEFARNNGVKLAACHGRIVQLPGYNMRCSIDRFHSNGTWGNRWFSLAFKDDPRLHWSATDKPGAPGYDHHQREPKGMPLEGYRPIRQGLGGIMHLWGITERRLIAKHAWYKMTEAIKWPEKSRQRIDTDYSVSIKGNPPYEMPDCWQFQKAPDEWWKPYAHLMQYLDLEVEPWQESECRRLWAQYGAGKFTGLDLFGVI